MCIAERVFVVKDILQLVSKQDDEACRNLRRGVIICPGGIGDCLLTLPLAGFLKQSCALGGVDFIGHTEYIGFYPGRTCIDSIKSIESIEFHRLFAAQEQFTVEDNDRLIASFARYECIVSFLGAGDANFEPNLIFTVNCSHPADITLLPLAAEAEFSGHISRFYIDRFARENSIAAEESAFGPDKALLTPHAGDVENGAKLLAAAGVNPDETLVVIHPGSGGRAKCRHPENYRQIADRLRLAGRQVVFLLGPAELERFDADTLGKFRSTAPCLARLDLAGVLQVMTHSNCYIGNDSGISHLAGAMGLRTLAMFGPTNSALYRPLGPDVSVMAGEADGFQRHSPATVDEVFERTCRILEN
ncbi:MAG: hypothetical protein DRP66_06450 [Planctomycetota bacterium]|nr:MAG: hypothetical protein DRP66_06450 [Planctomycetota bacterium]